METKKAIKIENANTNFGIFLMAMNTRFIFEYGDFIIPNTTNIDKFKSWCLRNGVQGPRIEQMQFSIIEITD